MNDQLDQVVKPAAEVIAGLPFMKAVVLGNALWQWLAAAVVLAFLYVAMRIAVKLFVRRVKALSGRTSSAIDDVVVGVLASTTRTFLVVFAMVVATLLLDLGPTATALRRWVVVIALTIQVGMWGQRAILLWLDLQRSKLAETDPGAVTTLQGLSYVARAVLWTAVVVLMLDNLGYNVKALVAGLGIGGVAVALALQSVLGDLFASLSIALDKPFVTGDFIVVDDKLGVVAKVGLKTTRVTALSGEQLVFSNSDLLKSRIRNFKKMQERRVAFSFGVLYQTPVQQLEEIPGIARAIIEGIETTRFDRAHFKEFGDSAYVFEIVYYVLDPDFTTYMDSQQRFNLELCRRFEDRGIGFAYPTRTLHLAPGTGPVTVGYADGEPGSSLQSKAS